ncbi:MAG TPA: ankyrin repeat domain-containing protein [Edaphocola sp.]|nr:ankyrin repeat domain-containing protein [Edaphocola sp.]
MKKFYVLFFIFVFFILDISIHAQSPVIDAIKDDDINKLERIINLLQLDINSAIDEDQNTLILHACYENKMKIVQWLYNKGALLNQPNKYGYTTLAIALENGNIDVGNFLIDNGFDIAKGMNINEKNIDYIYFGMSILYSRYPKNIEGTIKLIKSLYKKNEMLGESKITISTEITDLATFWAIVDNVEGLTICLKNNSGMHGVAALSIVADSINVAKFINLIEPIQFNEYLNSYPFDFNIRMQLTGLELAKRNKSSTILSWIEQL